MSVEQLSDLKRRVALGEVLTPIQVVELIEELINYKLADDPANWEVI